MTPAHFLQSHAALAATMLDNLMGLSKISWSDPRTTLAWRWPLPVWAWILLVALTVGIAALSYRRLLGPVWARAALATLRALVLLLIVALLLGPMLVLNQEKIEPDWLLMLVDRSASMRIRDVKSTAVSVVRPASTTAPATEPAVISAPSAALISRDRALHDALAHKADLFGPDKLGRDRRLLWLGFDAATYEIDPPLTPVSPAIPSTQAAADEPDGQATSIRTAIEQALQRAAGRPISGIVLLTDGQSPQSTSGDLVRRLQQQGVNVFTVPLGGDTQPLDLSIAQIESPERAFINDVVPVSVWIDRYPADARIDPSRLSLRLIDVATGKTLDQRSPADADLRQPVRLSAQSATVGPARWRVEMTYDAQAGQPGLSGGAAGNPARDVSVEMVDKPIRVLYVEGYPRWEYRYLKNMLVREKSIQSSMMLLSADRAFAQEGQLPIQRLPRDAAEFKPYDVIIIGDVPPDYFSPEQKTLIADQVSLRGAGLLWIGGGNDTPRSYEGSALATLLPMRSPAGVDRADPPVPLVVSPTPLAEALQVMRLRPPAPATAPSDAPATEIAPPGWPVGLQPLRWAQSVGELKPSAEVLAFARPFDAPAGGSNVMSLPLVTRLRYGAGQSLYVATDETWRWRYARGEIYFEQFWMQLVRMLGRNRLRQSTDRAAMEVSARRVQAGQAVVVDVTLNDELLISRELTQIAVSVLKAEGGPAGTQPGAQTGAQPAALERITLLPKPRSAASAGPATYTGLWRPSTSGKLSLRVVEPALDDLNVTQAIEVLRPDDELRQPAPDRDRLVALSRDTGGSVVELNNLDELARVVPNRARRTPNDIREPLWNSSLALMLVVGLLTLEWVGRKAVRLV
ncbi:MAG: VWA domain-containing protein [Planctomycetota bacterium]|nr:VWA domain-containing protein [Planctomycetota bacterium]